jgi:uncharacterized membrane protein HdeD (DUF308 family)
VSEMTGDYRGAAGMARAWWLYLITGTIWFILSLIVFRMNLTTVYAISILFGVIAISAAVVEFLSLWAAHGGWWKALHVFLSVVFLAVGVTALANPDWTFLALAAIIGWWFLFKGIFDVIVAFAGRGFPLWWVQLLVGVIELLLAFWAAGDFRESIILLVVYVGVVCLTKGITDIILAFRLHDVKKALAV